MSNNLPTSRLTTNLAFAVGGGNDRIILQNNVTSALTISANNTPLVTYGTDAGAPRVTYQTALSALNGLYASKIDSVSAGDNVVLFNNLTGTPGSYDASNTNTWPVPALAIAPKITNLIQIGNQESKFVVGENNTVKPVPVGDGVNLFGNVRVPYQLYASNIDTDPTISSSNNTLRIGCGIGTGAVRLGSSATETTVATKVTLQGQLVLNKGITSVNSSAQAFNASYLTVNTNGLSAYGAGLKVNVKNNALSTITYGVGASATDFETNQNPGFRFRTFDTDGSGYVTGTVDLPIFAGVNAQVVLDRTDQTISGTKTFSNDLNVSADLKAQGASLTVGQRLVVAGTAQMNAGIVSNGPVSVNTTGAAGALTRNIYTSGALAVAGNTSIGGMLQVGGPLYADGGLAVTGNAVVAGNLSCNVLTALSNKDSVSAVDAAAALVVQGGASIGARLNVGNKLHVGGNLVVAGNAAFEGPAVQVKRNLSVDGTLKVGESGALRVESQAGARVDRTLTVGGKSTFEDGLLVASGATVFNNTLDVTSTATFDSDVQVGGKLTVGQNSEGLKRDMTVYGNLTIVGGTLVNLNGGAGGSSLGATAVSGDVTVERNLTVSGNAMFKGEKVQVDGLLSLKKVGGNALDVAGNALVKGNLTVNQNLLVNGALAVKGNANFVDGVLAVKGNAYVTRNMTVTGPLLSVRDLQAHSASVAGNLTVANAALFSSGLTVNQNLLINSQLAVNTNGIGPVADTAALYVVGTTSAFDTNSAGARGDVFVVAGGSGRLNTAENNAALSLQLVDPDTLLAQSNGFPNVQAMAGSVAGPTYTGATLALNARGGVVGVGDFSQKPGGRPDAAYALEVAGKAHVMGRLSVHGNSNFSDTVYMTSSVEARDGLTVKGGAVNIQGNVTVDKQLKTNQLTVAGATAVSGPLTVSANSTFNGLVTAASGLSVTAGSLDIRSGADMKVSGAATFDGGVNINSGSSLTVKNGASLLVQGGGRAVFGSDVTVGKNLTVTGEHAVQGNLSVTQNAVFSGSSLTVGGAANLQGRLTVTGGNMSVSGNVGVSGNLSVSGSHTVGGFFAVGRDLTVQRNLEVTGNVSAVGLRVDGVATFGSDLIVDRNLTVAGNASFSNLSLENGGTVTVNKLINVNSNIVVSGGANVSVDGNLTVSRALVLNSSTASLTVQGPSTLTGSLVVGRNVDVRGQATLSGGLQVGNVGTNSYLNVSPAGVVDVYCGSNVPVFHVDTTGAAVKGNLAVTGIFKQSGGQSVLSNVQVLNVMNVQGAAVFQNSLQVNQHLNVNGNANVLVNGVFSVLGNVQFQGDVCKFDGSQCCDNGSDRRIKQNIQDAEVDACLESLRQIRLRTFQYTEDYAVHFHTGSGTQLGCIADELILTHPESVVVRPSFSIGASRTLENFMTINLGRQLYELIGSVQNLHRRLVDLQSAVDSQQQPHAS